MCNNCNNLNIFVSFYISSVFIYVILYLICLKIFEKKESLEKKNFTEIFKDSLKLKCFIYILKIITLLPRDRCFM